MCLLDDIGAKHSSSNLNSDQPQAISLLRSIGNRIWQYSRAEFYNPQNEKLKEDPKKAHLYNPKEKFNPKYHYIIDPTLVNPIISEIVDNFLASTTGVNSRRSELVGDTTKNIGRPSTNIVGQFKDLLSMKDSGLEEVNVE